MLNDQEIKKSLSEILQYGKNELEEDEIIVINDILQNKELREYLFSDDRTEPLIKKLSQKININDLEELMLLCSGAWLEATTGIVIDKNGKNLVSIDNNYNVQISKELKTSKFFVMQAILRHIERWVTMKHQGLLNPNVKVNKILEVGAGTLICSSMLREIYPNSLIIAEEPGLLSKKSLKIAKIKNINIIRSIEEINRNEKFDRILLHFVLEHCNSKEINRLIKKSIQFLAKDGVISIVIPNYNAFHRNLEIKLSAKERNKRTKLSEEDKLCGHKLIFDKKNIHQILQTQIDNLKVDLKIEYQTLLPRPLSFKNLTKIHEHQILAKLQKHGHIEGMENEGSVICLLVGKSPLQIKTPIDNTGFTKSIFTKLLKNFASTQSSKKTKEIINNLDL